MRVSRPAAGADAAAALGLHRPYVLTIATDDPRKNLDALLPCAAALAQRGIELVWAGDSRPQFARTKPLIGLRALGYVPDEHAGRASTGAPRRSCCRRATRASA